MQINKAKFERVVEEAKAKAANDPKWLRAIEKAAKAILSGEMIVTTLFTSCAFTGILKEREIAISTGGRGRALDNIFVERLWRSVKYEDVYIRDYETVPQVTAGLGRYFKFYNRE